METTDVPASAPPVARTRINILRPSERLIKLSYSFIRLGTPSRSTNPIDSHLSFDFQHLILVPGNSLDSRRGSVGFLKITLHIFIPEFLTNHLIQEYFWRWTSLPLHLATSTRTILQIFANDRKMTGKLIGTVPHFMYQLTTPMPFYRLWRPNLDTILLTTKA